MRREMRCLLHEDTGEDKGSKAKTQKQNTVSSQSVPHMFGIDQ